MTRGSHLLLAVFATLALGLPSAATAQGPVADRVRLELDVTDRRIATADGLVAEASNAQASAELDIAKQIEQRAWTAFNSGMPRVALAGTLDARTHADRSIAIVRGLPDPDRVTVQVQRTREIVDRARELVDGCGNPRAVALMRVALDMQTRAEQAVEDSRYLGALQLTLSARERVFKAQQLCNIAESLQDDSGRALGRTDDVLSRAREALGTAPDSRNRDLLSRAVSVQTQAQAEYRAGRYESALRLTQGARLMAQRVLRSSRTLQSSKRP